MVQRVTTSGTTSGNEWQQVVQRVTTSGTTSAKEWKWVTKSDNKWQWMASENSGTANENGAVHFMGDCHHFNNKKRYTTASN